MSWLTLIKRAIPKPVKRFLRRFIKVKTTPNYFVQTVSPCLPESICIDVGASYYPHVNWFVFLESAQTQWIAVEPNESNIGYIKSWAWASKVKAITTGLSREGGKKTLYVTNVDSGSSLLEPVIQEAMKHRVKKAGQDYFYPVRAVEIDTITLRDVIKAESPELPIFVKLDTQGTELSILQGAHEEFLKNRIVGIEMESTLLARPLYQGSGKFWEACQYLEQMGLELLDINPIRAPSEFGNKLSLGKCYLNECDAVFALRRDVAKTLPVEYRGALFAFYLTNKLFEEALSLLEGDDEVQAYFASRQVDIAKLSKHILGLLA